MKLEESFSQFIKNTVNLNKTRIGVAEYGIETITTFLQCNDVFGDIFINTQPQGSFRQETIIKPVDADLDFDVDMLFEVDEVDGWEPKDYLVKLSEEFKKTERYKNIVDTKGKERCVTIDYESDFHIDIVPAIKKGDSYLIMNKTTNQFEPTDGDGYAEWFTSKNDLTGNKYLIKVTRLIKYIRDTHKSFDVKSILLTTLLGNQVYTSDIKNSQYPDLPTAFLTIISRLDYFLQINPIIPIVSNPVLSTENFNRKWNQEKYSKFRDEINKIKTLAFDSYNNDDEVESLKKWQKIFGSDFILSEKEDSDIKVSKEEMQIIMLGDYSHREMPPWPKSLRGSVEIKRCDVSGKHLNMSLQSNAWPITDGYDLNYIAEITGISEPYEVWWQVVNTGEHARSIGEEALRGKIEPPKDSNRPLQQKEASSYTGKHWIQCFIVKNGYLIAESNPFFLNIFSKRRNRLKFNK